MTFKNGGWVLLLALIVFIAGGTWQTIQVLGARGEPKQGDGETLESYGFELTTPAVPPHLIVPTSLPRDGMDRLDFPPMMNVATWRESWSSGRYRKYLVASDRIVGVVINGFARAYPLRALTWHEVVNDTLGGVPIAVTYAPLADGVVVFERSDLGAADAPLVGFSGLVYNGCPLVYAVAPDADALVNRTDENLYSPLGLRAVSGPAASGHSALDLVPFAVVHWSDWIDEHPTTSVVEPSLEYIERYRSDPYHNYYGNDLLEEYPVEPGLPEGQRNKARVLALVAGDQMRVVTFEVVRANAGDGGTWTTHVGGAEVTLAYRTDPEVAWVVSGDAVGIPSFRWARHAMHPSAKVESGIRGPLVEQ